MSLRFTWDPEKARANERKHGVSFQEAVTVFSDPLAFGLEDALYPERMILIGESKKGRILFVVFVEFEEDLIRIVSARRTTAHERRRYEEGPF
jgi:hypothetical protein